MKLNRSLLVLVLAASPLLAQKTESWVGLQGGLTGQDNWNRDARSAPNLGLTVGTWQNWLWGAEGSLQETRLKSGTTGASTAEYHAQLSGLLRLDPNAKTWIPYARAGLGLTQVGAPYSFSTVTTTRPSYHLGLGLEHTFGDHLFWGTDIRRTRILTQQAFTETQGLVTFGLRWKNSARPVAETRVETVVDVEAQPERRHRGPETERRTPTVIEELPVIIEPMATWYDHPVQPTAAPAIVPAVPNPPASAPVIVAAAPNPPASAPVIVAAAPNPPASAPVIVAAAPNPPASAPVIVAAVPNPPASAPVIVAAAPNPRASAPVVVAAVPNPPASTPVLPPAAAPVIVAAASNPRTSAPVVVAAVPNPPASTPVLPSAAAPVILAAVPNPPTPTPVLPPIAGPAVAPAMPATAAPARVGRVTAATSRAADPMPTPPSAPRSLKATAALGVVPAASAAALQPLAPQAATFAQAPLPRPIASPAPLPLSAHLAAEPAMSPSLTPSPQGVAILIPAARRMSTDQGAAPGIRRAHVTSRAMAQGLRAGQGDPATPLSPSAPLPSGAAPAVAVPSAAWRTPMLWLLSALALLAAAGGLHHLQGPRDKA